MLSYYAAADVKAADAELVACLPRGVPMRRAAFGVAQAVLRELREVCGSAVGQPVWLVVGTGDNGGDALWAGAFLARRGVAVKALLTSPDRAHQSGLAAFRRAGGAVVGGFPAQLAPGQAAVVVDGVVGISGSGPLRGRAAAVFAQLPRTGLRMVAVDLPSGVDPDTGVVSGPAVAADVTVAMGVRKPVHALNPQRCGRVELVDVGYQEAGLGHWPGELRGLEPVLRTWQWQRARDHSAGHGQGGSHSQDGSHGQDGSQERNTGQLRLPGPSDDKYTQGVLGLVAGSPTYPGAGALCAAGALAMTSGMVRAVGPGAGALVATHPELVVSESVDSTGRVDAWVVGPGADESTEELMLHALATDAPVLADASALRLVPGAVKGRTAPTLITPHDREFEAFAGRPVGADRVEAAKSLAAESGAAVLLKGHITIIASPEGEVWANPAGNSWAATAGSGDVLSGMAGAMLAAGRGPLAAACAAADVHSRAAGLAAGGEQGAPITASMLAAHIADAIREIRAGKTQRS